MKSTIFFCLLVIVCLFALADAQCGGPICATDRRSGNQQNFNSICAMHDENRRGGRKKFLLRIFKWNKIEKIS